MNREGEIRIPSGCAIAAVISREGKKMSGEMITQAMKPMHERSNGLGGGFAGYGIYPEYKDFYALHTFFDDRTTRKECEVLLKEYFEVVHSERIPTRKIPEITDEPMIWRYFVSPLRSMLQCVPYKGPPIFRPRCRRALRRASCGRGRSDIPRIPLQSAFRASLPFASASRAAY